MDRVARRYADPFSFLEAYFRAGRFYECVISIVKVINNELEREEEDRQEKMLWELWLHKYEGKQSFSEWKEHVLAKSAAKPKEKPKVVETANMSKNLDIAAQTLAKLQRSQKKGGG